MEALELVLVKQLKEMGSAKIPRRGDEKGYADRKARTRAEGLWLHQDGPCSTRDGDLQGYSCEAVARPAALDIALVCRVRRRV